MEELNIEKLRDFIIKVLDFYDKNNLKYIKYINSKIEINKNDEGDDIAKFIYNKEEIFKAKCQICGYYDISNNIWFWGWLLPLTNHDTILSRELLDYGLKLEPATNNNEHYYIKSQLLNSRITIEDMIELDIHLALSSYLIKDLYSFIKPLTVFLDKDKTKYITYYYLIK